MTITTAHLLIAAIAVTISSPIVWRIFHNRFDPFEPIVTFFLAFGTIFCLRPLATLLSGDLIYERPSRIIDLSSSFDKMLIMALIAAISYVVGYATPIGERLAQRIRPPSGYHLDSTITATICVLLLGISAFLLFLWQGGGIATILSGRSDQLGATIARSSTYILTASYLLIPATLIFFVLARIHKKGGLTVLGIVGILLILIRSVPTGDRIMLLPFVCCSALLYYVLLNRRLNAFSGTTLIILALIGSSVLLHTRGSGGNVFQSTIQVIHQPSSWLDPVLKGDDAEMSSTLAAALQIVPEETGYRLGRSTVGDFLLRPIPREWWQQKPEIPRRDIIQLLWPREYAAGIANPEFSALLWYYLDFSWSGVVVAMTGYGIMTRGLYEYYRRHAKHVNVQVMYGLSLGFIVIGIRDSPVDTLIRTAFVVAPVWLIFRVGRRREEGMPQ